MRARSMIERISRYATILV